MHQQLIEFLSSLGFENIEIQTFNMDNAPIEEGEVVLGDMTDLEKSCQVFLRQQQIDHEKLHEKMELAANQDEANQLEHEHDIAMRTVRIVKEIMWTSAKKRFGYQKDSGGIGFRAGNKVVSMPVKEEGGNFPFSLLGGRGGITVIEMGIGVGRR